MTEDNRKENSLIPISSTSLVRVGNSIELTNKIITKYSIRIVPYRVDKLWYIYNIDSKIIISEGYDLIEFIDNSFTNSKSLLITNEHASAFLVNPSQLANLIWYKDLKPIAIDKMKMIAYHNGKSGLIDSNCKILIPFAYDKIIDKLRFRNASSQGILVVINNRKYGVIDINNYSVILPINYDLIEETGYVDTDNILKVKQGNKIGVFDCKQKSLLFLADFIDISWCNEGICSVKIDNKWVLFDYHLNKLINKSEYESTQIFTDGYSICKKNNSFYAVYKNGFEVKLSIDCETNSNIWIHRFNDIFIVTEINTTHKQNGNVYYSESFHKFHIYYKLLPQSIINYKQQHRHCNVRVKNNIIEIIEAGKYGGYFPVKYYNINGEEISEKNIAHLTSNQSENNINIPPNSERGSNIKSNWKIVDKKLFYKNELAYEHPDGELEADLTLDFPKLTAIVDVDPEFGIMEDFVGYIDQYGNKFWEDNS